MLKTLTNVSNHLQEITRANLCSINGAKIETIYYFYKSNGYETDGELYVEFTDVNDNLRYVKHSKRYPEITSVQINVQ